MGADAAWRVTSFVLRVSSCFYLACVENDLETALVYCCSAHENHEGGEYDIISQQYRQICCLRDNC